MLDQSALERVGVFRDPRTQQLMRHRIRNTNFEYDPDDPQAQLHGALLGYEQQLVPHPVILPLATDEASIQEAQQKAINAGADFYHPQHGWLRWGRKRELERPENLGAATATYQTRRVRMTQPAPPEDPPAEVTDPETETETETDVVPEGDDIRAPQGPTPTAAPNGPRRKDDRRE